MIKYNFIILAQKLPVKKLNSNFFVKRNWLLINNLNFKMICEVVFFVFIFYFTFNELMECWQEGPMEYLKEFWNLIELALIITGLISFVMSILRLIEANKVLEFFKTTGGYGFINLQTVDGYNQVLTYSLGMCATLGTIKFLKMLRFNSNITILGVTLKICFDELASFSVVFFLIWISFVQLMHLIFGSSVEGLF